MWELTGDSHDGTQLRSQEQDAPGITPGKLPKLSYLNVGRCYGDGDIIVVMKVLKYLVSSRKVGA